MNEYTFMCCYPFYAATRYKNRLNPRLVRPVSRAEEIVTKKRAHTCPVNPYPGKDVLLLTIFCFIKGRLQNMQSLIRISLTTVDLDTH